MKAGMRREARRLAVCAVYAREVTGYPVEEGLPMLQEMREPDQEWPEFAKQLSEVAEKHETEISELLQQVLENWRIDRVSPVERAILKLGCAEICWFTDIPPRVTINEYIELAKVYANDNAPPFINGVLDKLVQIRKKKDFTARGPKQIYKAGSAGSAGANAREAMVLVGESSASAANAAQGGGVLEESSPEESLSKSSVSQPPSLELSRINSRWAREAYEALMDLGGEGSVDEILSKVNVRGAAPASGREKDLVTGALRRHCAENDEFEGDLGDPYADLFADIGDGRWALRGI